MHLLPVDQITVGMRLGKSLFAMDGRLLLSAGTTLNRASVQRLTLRGYATVYIADSLNDVELPDIISDSTRQEVMRCTDDFLRRGVINSTLALTAKAVPAPEQPVATGQAANQAPVPPVGAHFAQRMERAADILVDEVLSAPQAIIGLVDLKSMNDVSFAHSVQVALASLVVGRVMGLDRGKLRQIGLGTLLHDVGKTRVDNKIWSKPGRLSPDEMKEVEYHTVAGYEILTQANTGLLESHVAFQHHERWNGSGYPRGLSGRSISTYSRICGVCDTFDAMISDRPYKKALHPFEALQVLNNNASILFDPDVVKALCSVVAPYPIATSVRLSTGDLAVVKRLVAPDLSRPVVLVTKDADDKPYIPPHELDLSQEKEITIKEHYAWLAPATHSAGDRKGTYRGAAHPAK
jgi:HD-GYP domain-containing protein (c-di-GMP phosphodiesterase class II)